MACKNFVSTFILTSLMSLFLTSCYRPYSPPFNNFENSSARPVIKGNLVVEGRSRSIYKESKKKIIRNLGKYDMQFIQYGDTTTLIVPTDRYFLFNSPRLNDLCYPGLMNLIKLLKLHQCSMVYVAGFTDNIGSRRHKYVLTQARAEAMVTFLWANGIPSQVLHAEGYGDKHAVSPNRIIHGSAFNRRLEIQWFRNAPLAVVKFARPRDLANRPYK